MIQGSLAVALNVLEITILTFIVSNVVISAAVSVFSPSLLKMQVSSRKALLWLVVFLPWLVGIAIAGYFLNGYFSSSIFEAESGDAHWHHMEVFTWLSWHGIVMVSAILFSLYLAMSKTIQFVRHRRDLSLLSSMSTLKDDGYYEIAIDSASAFTAGFINKKCFVTEGLLKEVESSELAIILQHEKAHAANNDPFKKWLYSILSAFFIKQIAIHLRLHMTLAMEHEADNAVIDGKNSSTFVASTLVKIARLNAKGSPIRDSEMVTNFGADVLEQRVYFLLGQLDLKPLNKMSAAFFIFVVVGVSLSSVDKIHHFVEIIFNH